MVCKIYNFGGVPLRKSFLGSSFLNLLQAAKVTIMYALQNNTEIQFNIVLYIKITFLGQGMGVISGL